MIVKRVVQILVNEVVVDAFEYQTPMNQQEREDLQLFLHFAMLDPRAVVACINTKDGVGEHFTLVPPDKLGDLF